MALDLGKQVGPLPLGAWIAVVGGGLGIGWYFSKSSGTGASDSPHDALVPVTDPGVGVGGGQFIYDPPTSVDNPAGTITDNAGWGRQAINWLIAQQYDPGTAQTAIAKFLNGTNRTLVEQTLVNLALVKFGTPPEEVPVPETPVNPPPPNQPPTQLAKYTYHTVAKGETIGSLADRYSTSWWNIYVANDQVGLRPDGSRGVLTGPWAVKAGQRLVIPTVSSGGLAKPPAAKPGAIRYYTPGNGETVSTIAKKFSVHPSRVFEYNDIAGLRPDGSPGFLTNPSQIVPKGRRLIIPY